LVIQKGRMNIMKDFQEFIKENKTALFELAERNTKYNAEGHAVLEKDDEWRNEPEWDIYYKELVANGGNRCR